MVLSLPRYLDRLRMSWSPDGLSGSLLRILLQRTPSCPAESGKSESGHVNVELGPTACGREDSNLHSVRNQVLNLARLPFRHARSDVTIPTHCDRCRDRFVGRRGLEPRTLGLRGPCSAELS